MDDQHETDINLQREEVAPAGRWYLPPKTLLLLGSGHFGWVGLRAVLQKEPSTHIVADVTDPGQAVDIARRERPDGILAASDLAGISIAELAKQLRVASPASRLVVFSDALDHDMQVALRAAGGRGFVLWEDVTPDVIHGVLRYVLVCGLYVASIAAVDEMIAPAERRRWRRTDHFQLTDRERAVLKALAAGSTTREIAEQYSLSRRTVERTVTKLSRKFGVAKRSLLIARAIELGFGP